MHNYVYDYVNDNVVNEVESRVSEYSRTEKSPGSGQRASGLAWGHRTLRAAWALYIHGALLSLDID
jgi:hypothetical protein